MQMLPIAKNYRFRFCDGILHRGVKVLQRLKVFHFGLFNAERVATGARFLEFLKPQRQLAIRMF